MYKRILYFSDCELLAYQAQGKRLFDFRSFPFDANGPVALASYLKQDIKTPVYWLIDSTHEEYQNILIPHVSGSDRKTLLQHRMRRMFEDTEYTYAEVQQRESEGRGDDRVLFTALNNPTELKPWLAQLVKHKIPLAGIYSVPLLSQSLLRYLPRNDYHLLVVHNPRMNPQTPYALRQNFFFKQKLQLSRLVPVQETLPTDYAALIVNQCLNTMRYLSTARLLSHSSRMAITFIVPPTLRPAVWQQLQQQDIPNANVTLLDTGKLAEQFNLQVPTNTALYFHHFISTQLSSAASKNHYATLPETRYFWHQRLNQALYWSAGAVLGLSLFVAGSGLWATVQHVEAGLMAQQQFLKRNTELNGLRNNLPEFEVDIIHLRNIVDVGRFLNTRNLQPEPSWQVLSEVLIRHPTIRIEKLSWSTADERPTIFRYPQTVEEKLNPAPTSHPQARQFFEVLQIAGTIDAPRQNYRANNRAFNRFIEALKTRTYQAWHVEILATPYQDNPNPSLSTPDFEIELQVIHTPSADL